MNKTKINIAIKMIRDDVDKQTIINHLSEIIESRKEIDRTWYQKNKDKMSATRKEYKRKHPKEWKAMNKKSCSRYYRANIETFKKQREEYYQKNKATILRKKKFGPKTTLDLDFF